MTTETITIRVDPAAARAFDAAPTEDQRKMQLLLGLRLQDLTASDSKSLKAVMDEIGFKAKARGLTPAILESLLDEK